MVISHSESFGMKQDAFLPHIELATRSKVGYAKMALALKVSSNTRVHIEVFNVPTTKILERK